MKRYLAALLAKRENQACADCGQHGPTWASLSFGVFICMNCSGIHRNLSVLHTRVKSTSLDEWEKEWVEIMCFVGNSKANEYWEHSLPKGFSRQKQPHLLKEFIVDKYIKKRWAHTSNPEPLSFFAQFKAGELEIPVQKQEESKVQENLLDLDHQPQTRKPSAFGFISKEKKQENLFSNMKVKGSKLKKEENVDLLDFSSEEKAVSRGESDLIMSMYKNNLI